MNEVTERWHECAEGDCQCGQILGQNSEYICTVENPAARRRILACVNACAGLHTKVVQTIAAFGGMSQDTAVAAVVQQRDAFAREVDEANERVAAVTDQRDQLLAALEALILFTKPSKSNAAALANAYTAIAAAKGGAA